MKKGIICLLVLMVFIPSACSMPVDSDNTNLAVLAPETEMTIASYKIQVSEFISQNINFTSSYDNDECYNITPDFIADNSEFTVFKYDISTESFIMYDGDAYSIGTCFGGSGITSMALADINMDNQYELYYTFSWGSGIPRSQIGYFDPVNKKVTIFDFDISISETMLTINESGDLCVKNAIIEADSFVDFTIKAQDLIGTIVFEKNEIMLKFPK